MLTYFLVRVCGISNAVSFTVNRFARAVNEHSGQCRKLLSPQRGE